MTTAFAPPAHVWIVEHYWEHKKIWKPTVGIGIDREQGRARLNDWQARNPDDKFRLARYRRLKP